MKHQWKHSIAVLAALSLASLQACSAAGGPVSGVVIDEATGKPVADAIVVMRWHSSGINHSYCHHVATARTDASGRYRIAAWITPLSLRAVFMSSAGIDYHAYKPGYVTIFREGTIALPAKIVIAPFKGTKDEYFEQVLSLRIWGCAQAGDSQTSLVPFYVAAAREAAALAETQKQKSTASFLASLINDPLGEKGNTTR